MPNSPNISDNPQILRTADRDAARRLIRDAEIATKTGMLPPGTPGGPVPVTNYSPHLATITENLYYRQSMLRDYLTCPMMMLYKWLVGHEEQDTFFAAVLGTAGHKIIEEIHQQRRYDWPVAELAKRFLECVEAAIKDSKVPPKLSANFDTLQSQANAVCAEYVSMLRGYQAHEDNHHFHPTMLEQSFVLEVEDEFGRKFLFTGVIDQCGFYDDGHFVLRDIKFRQNDFKPGSVALKLDLQLCLYAFAVKFGNPSCDECKPKYILDDTEFPLETNATLPASTGSLLYTGPCEACKQKIGTAQWPRLIPVRTELIWMRDYMPRQRDEYAHFIDDPEKVKERNPNTGRMKIRQITNPSWAAGYKKGDPSGKAIYRSERSQSFLEVRIADATRVAAMIRDGRFYRKEGSHCNFWCKFREPCLNMLETEIEDKDATRMAANIETYDPFGV